MACSAAAAERTSPTSSSSSSNGTGHHTHVPTKDWQAADGTVIKVMAQDYGFRTGGSRLYEEHYGEVPKGIFQLVRLGQVAEWRSCTLCGQPATVAPRNCVKGPLHNIAHSTRRWL